MSSQIVSSSFSILERYSLIDESQAEPLDSSLFSMLLTILQLARRAPITFLPR